MNYSKSIRYKLLSLDIDLVGRDAFWFVVGFDWDNDRDYTPSFNLTLEMPFLIIDFSIVDIRLRDID